MQFFKIVHRRIYIYIYIERERERGQAQRKSNF